MLGTTLRFARFGIGVAVSLACFTGVIGCAGNQGISDESSSSGEVQQAAVTKDAVIENDSVAAIVDGQEIMESSIAYEIQSARAMYGYEDDASWAQALADAESTPAGLRDEYIDAMVEDILVREHAGDVGVVLDESDVDRKVEETKEAYEDGQWDAVLAESGMTEDDYRAMVRDEMLRNALYDAFVANVSDYGDELASAIEMYAPHYDGAKRSSHILFKIENADDASAVDEVRKKAQAVLDELNAGKDFAEAAKQYSEDSSAENGGDVGWDKASGFVSGYQTALDALSKGEMSGLVETEFGIHIILCTDVLDLDDDVAKVKLSDFPDDVAEDVEAMARDNIASNEYQAWVDGLRDAADIVVNDMPDGLPYDVAVPEKSDGQEVE